MALELKLTNTINSITELTLTDSSGEYSVSNTTGWGAPNFALADVNYAHLIITTPNAEIYDIDIIDDLGIDFSTATVEDLVYTITNDMLGGTLGNIISDGVYSIEYKISDNAYSTERELTDPLPWGGSENDYSLTLNVMTYYEVQNDVFARIGELPTYFKCGGCDNKYIKETSTLFMLLQSVITAATYSNSDLFEIALESLQDILLFDSNLDEDCGC